MALSFLKRQPGVDTADWVGRALLNVSRVNHERAKLRLKRRSKGKRDNRINSSQFRSLNGRRHVSVGDGRRRR